jgi:excisionase family DNA binding protein
MRALRVVDDPLARFGSFWTAGSRAGTVALVGERADLAALMRPTEAARVLAISRRTLSHWAAAGLLPYRETPGGHRRFPREAVLALAAELDHSDQGLRVARVRE